jgi:O-antigen/teichoic acid export membrane protein
MSLTCETSITKIQPDDKMQDKNSPMRTKFVGQGMLLFIDLILLAITNWFYWLVISRFASTSEIGQATSVYSLVLLIAVVSQIGLEYPLLKKSSLQRSHVFGTALAIELIMTSGAIAAVIFLANTDMYHVSLGGYVLVAVTFLALSQISFISRYALLGISNARSVVVFNIVATGGKFLTAYILLSMGFGVFGILFSFLIASLVSAIGMMSIAGRQLSFKPVRDKLQVIEVLKEGLSNAPSKLSRTIIMTLSVILLASFGISDSDIGIFYIAMMLSVVGSSLAGSMSYTVIPASTESKVDLSSGSLRLGLSFTAPIVAALIVAPRDILSIIGPQYASADTILLVLAMGIMPIAISVNAVSKFNNLDHGRRVIAIGIIQAVGFLASFFILVPYYGILGAAYSILIAYTASAVYAVAMFETYERRYVSNCIVAIIIGCAAGYAINLMLGHSLPTIVSSVAATSVVLLALRNTSVSELRQLVLTMRNPRESHI